MIARAKWCWKKHVSREVFTYKEERIGTSNIKSSTKNLIL